jgi:uncharacterized protein (UPF0276 family)
VSFLARVGALPTLGIGISTEYGARRDPDNLDPDALRAAHPDWAAFLEVGVEVAAGLDADARAWAAAGRPTTHHFLDLNLDEPEDFDAAWLDALRAHVADVRPAWLCGDAGLWHMGRRERGHMLLLPPVLTDDSARAIGAGVARLRETVGLEVLPENPPGAAYVGNLHLLDAFARVCEAGDTGMLLDAAHLAIYQRLHGHAPLTGLDGFPLDRIVEIHVAGGSLRDVDGWVTVEDDHAPDVLPDTWAILAHVAARAPNLRAVVVECERNPMRAVVPIFREVERRVAGSAFDLRRRSASVVWGGGLPAPRNAPGRGGGDGPPPAAHPAAVPRQAVQRAVVRLLHTHRPEGDPDAPTARLLERLASEGSLTAEELGWLRAVDPRAWRTDPYRCGRLLAALVDEFPRAVAAHGQDMLPFFASDVFDAALRDGGSLAVAFGTWLQGVGSPEVAGHARVETAVAACRRARGPADAVPGARMVRLAPGCACVAGPLPPPHPAEGHVLVRVDSAGLASVEGLPDALAVLLAAATRPTSRAALERLARAGGADPGEDREIVDELVADGILTGWA